MSSTETQTLCWIDGQRRPPDEASVSIFDHGLLYGDGVFEGIRLYQQRPFMLRRHLQRLTQSANAIDLVIPYSHDQLVNAITGLVQEWRSDTGYLRRVVRPGSFFIFSWPVSAYGKARLAVNGSVLYKRRNAVHKC